MSTLKYFLVYASKQKARVHQLDFIVSFLQANVKHRYFVRLEIRYGYYFPEYCNNFGIPLILKNSMYRMTNSGEIFSDCLTN